MKHEWQHLKEWYQTVRVRAWMNEAEVFAIAVLVIIIPILATYILCT